MGACLHVPQLSWATDAQAHHTFAHHTQALSGSAFNSPKNLPETAHAPCQVAMAMALRNQETHR